MDESAEWPQLAEWFEMARALPPAQRDALVRNAPLSDAMRRDLESLLQHAPRAEQFFVSLQQAVSDASADPTDMSVSSLSMNGDALGQTNEALASMVGRDIAHYHIVAELGRGGMGVVYQATDVRLQRTVALKLLRTKPVVHTSNGAARDTHSVATATADAEARAKRKMLAEARASASLDHPNICTVYEVGETDDKVPYIAMAYYAGETLEQRLKYGPLPVDMAVDIAAQIASGLSAAHDRGIVHRDVKPANVLVTDQGTIKLLDFGIARDLSGGAPRTTPRGFTPGTISYMSPEQISGMHVDQRTDLWSLGVVLFEMCAGRRPFVTKHVGGMLYDIAYTPAPPLRSLRAEVPPGVERVVARLLEKDAAHRYGSARDVLHDLLHDALHDSMQAPEPVVASEPAPTEPTTVWRRVLAKLGIREPRR